MTNKKQTNRILNKLYSMEGRTADLITNFAGSMFFAYLHLVWFSLWILINLGLFKPFIVPFDEFPYGLLTMIVSLEAIFLSTFIMVSQKRQALIDEYREIEEDIEEEESEKEVTDIQNDLDHIKKAISSIQQKINHLDKRV